MATPYPDYEDTMRESQEIADACAGLATYEEIGPSDEGRPLPLLTLTDPAVPVEQKSVFFLTGGTDGDEETGRAVALAVARALTRPENRVHLQRQVVLVVPNTNPDGCVRDQAGNSAGLHSADIYSHEPPRSAEGCALRALAEAWLPDAHVDFHGLAGGSMGDYSFLYPTVNNKWSVPVLMEVNRELEAAGARAGYPQSARPRLWLEPRTNLAGWMARNHSALCMVVETPENYYPIEDSVRSGLARMMRLIEIGEEMWCFQNVPNYPVDVVSGDRMGALMPYGADYATRRRCRRDISQMVIEGVPWFGRVECDYDWTAVVRLPVEDSVKTFPPGLAFQATLDGRAQVRKVLWQDHELEGDLWSVRREQAGLVVRAEVPEPPRRGENLLSIVYEVPFKRHVERRRPERR